MTELRRSLGPIDAASLVVSNTVGVGIFTTPAFVSCLVPHTGTRIALWLTGGVLAAIGATAYAELAAARPRAGGEYVYIRDAFGPVAGFLAGWTSFVAGFSGAIAAAAIAAAALLTPALEDPGLPRVSPAALAAVLVAAAAAVHIAGLNTGRRLQNALTAIKVICLLLVAFAGFTTAPIGPRLDAGPAGGGAAWLAAVVPVMFSYSGWNAASYVAEEIRHPSRNVPLALLLGTGVVVALYIAVNLAYSHVFSSAGLCRATDPAAALTERAWGRASSRVMTVVSLVVLLSSISAMTVAGPRVYFSMARDGVFPPVAAHVHPRFHTPAAATAAQAVWTVALICTGTFQQLLAYTGFAVLLFAALAVSCVFVQRRGNSAGGAPFQMWGYPALPAVFVLVALLALVAVVATSPAASLAGLGIISAGLPLYLVVRPVGRARLMPRWWHV